MSRWLVIAAAALFALVGLSPLGAMLARIQPADLGRVVEARTLGLLGRTLGLGLSVGLLALVVGAPFGWLCARTDLALRSLLRPLGVVPLLVPPLVLAMTLSAMTGLRGGVATALCLAASTFPLVALFVGRASTRIDARLVEAARLTGGLGAVVRLELPLLLPSAATGAALAFVFAVNDFAVPDYLSSIGTKFNVYADEVFARWQTDHEAGGAVAAALPLVLLTVGALLPALHLRRRGPAASLGGAFRAPEPVALGPWRWPLSSLALALVAAAALAPIARLAWESGGGAHGFALATARAAFDRALELARANLAASLVYAAAAALVCVPLGLVLGHALERSRAGRWAELVASLPFAVPGILIGIGSIVVWNRPWTAAIYDGGAMVVVLFVARFAAASILGASSAVAAVDRSLEEAAALAGAGPTTRLFRIVAPAIRPALLGSFTAVFVLAMRELDAAILVPAANHTVMFRVYNAVHFGRDDFVAALCLLVIFFIVLPALLWSLLGRERLEVLP